MPGKYIAKKYTSVRGWTGSSPNVITWLGDTDVQIEPFAQRNLEPNIPYSLDKRKRWLMEEELRKILLNECNSPDKLIAVSKCDPYFPNKAISCVHTIPGKSAMESAILGCRANVRSCLHYQRQAQRSISSDQLSAIKGPSIDKYRKFQTHRAHHKPGEDEDSQANKPQEDIKSTLSSAVSIELTGYDIRLKSKVLGQKWKEINKHEKHKLYEDIQDAFREYCLNDESTDGVLEDETKRNENNLDTIPAEFKVMNTSELSERNDSAIMTRMIIPHFSIKFMLNPKENVATTHWYPVRISELMLVDVKQALDRVGLTVTDNVVYLSYFTPLSFIVCLTPLIHKLVPGTESLEVFLLIVQKSIPRNCLHRNLHKSHELSPTYMFQVQIQQSMPDVMTLKSNVQTDILYEDSFNFLLLDSFDELITLVTQSVAEQVECSFISTEDTAAADDYLLVSLRLPKFTESSLSAENSYVIINDNPVDQNDSTRERMRDCSICSNPGQETEHPYPCVGQGESVKPSIVQSCSNGHYTCVNCLQLYINDSLLKTDDLPCSFGGYPQIACPGQNCTQMLPQSINMCVIPAPYLFRFVKSHIKITG